MKKLMVIPFITAVLTLGTAQSQVPEQWNRTLRLNGDWQGPAILTLEGQNFHVIYHTNFQTILNGVGMTMDEGFTDPDLGELTGANLIGYNPADNLIHWESVDNFGTAHEHTGSWLNPKHFHMEHHSMQGTSSYSEYIDIRLKSNNHRALVDLIATLDGDTVEVVRMNLHRMQNGNRAESLNTGTPVENEVTIFPNPSFGEFEIVSDAAIDEVVVTNEAGQQILRTKPNDTDLTINLEKPGMFFIRITCAGKTETKKIMVTR